ncbi:MAG: 50S ribosomal protein L3 [Spirochaetaceae bacterium]|nr:50S ribosomal protein L3 [Spirochaetaceae bacterium]
MVGLIGRKIGMTQVFDDSGILVPVTVISIAKNIAIACKTEEKDGYKAVVLGSVDMKAKQVSKPYLGQFKDVAPKKALVEFRDFDKEYKVGDEFGVELFESVRFVDIIGTSKGKGFAGVMKRHNFHGGRKTHGSDFHREPGSTGQNTMPGNTKKGRKMPGRMGNERVTVQSLRVVKVDAENGVVLVKGAIPGANNNFVLVRKAKKKG